MSGQNYSVISAPASRPGPNPEPEAGCPIESVEMEAKSTPLINSVFEDCLPERGMPSPLRPA